MCSWNGLALKASIHLLTNGDIDPSEQMLGNIDFIAWTYKSSIWKIGWVGLEDRVKFYLHTPHWSALYIRADSRISKIRANLAPPFWNLGPTCENWGPIRYNNKENMDKIGGIWAHPHPKMGPPLEKVCQKAQCPLLHYTQGCQPPNLHFLTPAIKPYKFFLIVAMITLMWTHRAIKNKTNFTINEIFIVIY